MYSVFSLSMANVSSRDAREFGEVQLQTFLHRLAPAHALTLLDRGSVGDHSYLCTRAIDLRGLQELPRWGHVSKNLVFR